MLRYGRCGAQGCSWRGCVVLLQLHLFEAHTVHTMIINCTFIIIAGPQIRVSFGGGEAYRGDVARPRRQERPADGESGALEGMGEGQRVVRNAVEGE